MVNSGCLSSEDFLLKVAEYFKISNERNIAVRLTLKRLVEHDEVELKPEYDVTNQPAYDVSTQAQSLSVTSIKPNNNDREYSLLVRASYGSHKGKNKCSTIISAGSLDKFWQDYSSVVRTNMDGLVKKKKKKRSTKTALKSKKSVKN
ncbi:hypothetical protein TPHA_0C03770 [Tetrapisispora phaffii CBS 4417]|uniref:Signal recognition particle subunit SRP14 n=1 Tax=Tetrapisispora phaffii (strain ATCC 24235 / CBS 4417 / NBRC 1672 / NRRL Y-8282 / UCD 70-5) TaxID=1071381 RepID=G8BQL7_TETPH|nr:hypothetical protein TPHA_0C03770 [Tetrapisispora phaffii CBS 4417]CCE62529.1 hypothetical protein TPHA_0C03770 [Tetrapisispora phaffii CBS 4417]